MTALTITIRQSHNAPNEEAIRNALNQLLKASLNISKYFWPTMSFLAGDNSSSCSLWSVSSLCLMFRLVSITAFIFYGNLMRNILSEQVATETNTQSFSMISLMIIMALHLVTFLVLQLLKSSKLGYIQKNLTEFFVILTISKGSPKLGLACLEEIGHSQKYIHFLIKIIKGVFLYNALGMLVFFTGLVILSHEFIENRWILLPLPFVVVFWVAELILPHTAYLWVITIFRCLKIAVKMIHMKTEEEPEMILELTKRLEGLLLEFNGAFGTILLVEIFFMTITSTL